MRVASSRGRGPLVIALGCALLAIPLALPGASAVATPSRHAGKRVRIARSPARKPDPRRIRAAAPNATLEVKFVEGADIHEHGDHFVTSTGAPRPDVTAVLRRYPVRSIRPVFPEPAADLAATQRAREARSGRDLANLALYFLLQPRRGTNAAALADALNALSIVEAADLAPAPAPPPASPDFRPRQKYRGPATTDYGIDAAYANQFPGGRADGVKISDLEYGWNTKHEDLAKARVPGTIIHIGTPLNPYGDDHGTAVLGMLVGTSNTFGVTGLAPNASLGLVNLYSIEYGFNVAAAVNSASRHMHAGDVMVIEMQVAGKPGSCDFSQVGCVPVEWDNATYDAIVGAVADGIVVVEAGGNGSVNLNDAYYGSPFPHGRANSGAIIVGAARGECDPSHPRARVEPSNWGTRLDLQGWGQCITTTGYGDLYYKGNNAAYTADFGGTSGATPMVASAAAIVSGVAKQLGITLRPSTVKTILKSTGRAQDPTDTKLIGREPDLRAALEAITGGHRPTLASPVHRVVANSLATSTISISESWSATDTSGVAAYRLWQALGSAPFSRVTLTPPTTTTATFVLRPGTSYSYAVAAKSAVGTWSPLRLDRRFAATLVQENAGPALSGPWTRTTITGASGGYTDKSSTAGARITYSFTGNSVGLVAARGPDHGEVDVYLDNVLKERLDFFAASTSVGRVTRSYTFGTRGTHKISLVVVGTPGRPRVDFDAFATT